MFVCVCVCACVCVCISLCRSVCICSCMCSYMYVYVCVSVCVCVNLLKLLSFSILILPLTFEFSSVGGKEKEKTLQNISEVIHFLCLRNLSRPFRNLQLSLACLHCTELNSKPTDPELQTESACSKSRAHRELNLKPTRKWHIYLLGR